MDIDPRALYPAIGFLIIAKAVWSWYRHRVMRALIQREGELTRLSITAAEFKRERAERIASEQRARAKLWPEAGESFRDDREGSHIPPDENERGSR